MRPSILITAVLGGMLSLAVSAHSGDDHAEKSNKDEHAEDKANSEEHGHDHGDEHSDRAEHFEGKPAKNLTQALKNFRTANDKLDKLLAKDELSSGDMTQIHKLSYTLENAMGRMNKELETMGADLEWVHKASERMDEATVRARGESYIEAANKLAE